MEKYVTVRQGTDENIIWRMLFVCRINVATNTGSEYVICFSTAAVVARTRLNVTLTRTFSVLFPFLFRMNETP